MDSRNHALVIDPIDMQSRPMNFNITEYEKFIYGFRFSMATNL